jgi:hypothetical protein
MSKHHLPGYNDDDIIDITSNDQGDLPSLPFKKRSITPVNCDNNFCAETSDNDPMTKPVDSPVETPDNNPTASTIPVDSPNKTLF